MSQRGKALKKERNKLERQMTLICTNQRKLRKKNLKAWRAIRAGQAYPHLKKNNEHS